MLVDSLRRMIAALSRTPLGDFAAPADPLRGVWTLVSYWARDPEGGEPIYPMGKNAFGYLMYGAGNRMSALVASEGRPVFGDASGAGGSLEQKANAFSTAIAYMADYRWEGDRVLHKVDIALNPSWIGVEQVRYAKLEGNRLTLTTPPAPTPPDGKVSVGTLVWERRAGPD
jgi:hypothetical protein